MKKYLETMKQRFKKYKAYYITLVITLLVFLVSLVLLYQGVSFGGVGVVLSFLVFVIAGYLLFEKLEQEPTDLSKYSTKGFLTVIISSYVIAAIYSGWLLIGNDSSFSALFTTSLVSFLVFSAIYNYLSFRVWQETEKSEKIPREDIQAILWTYGIRKIQGKTKVLVVGVYLVAIVSLITCIYATAYQVLLVQDHFLRVFGLSSLVTPIVLLVAMVGAAVKMQLFSMSVKKGLYGVLAFILVGALGFLADIKVYQPLMETWHYASYQFTVPKNAKLLSKQGGNELTGALDTADPILRTYTLPEYEDVSYHVQSKEAYWAMSSALSWFDISDKKALYYEELPFKHYTDGKKNLYVIYDDEKARLYLLEFEN
ncbi:MAG: hypothetical protein LBI43_04060 [Streptococcaceae bacterium]|jgi:hypothetical protein|nr:hypothetical protein [Streptococcaceae bacterium]